MTVIDLVDARRLAQESGKSIHLISRIYFELMQKRGNNHYCCHCGAAFTLNEKGELINYAKEDQVRLLDHSDMHQPGVIGNCLKYVDAWHWIEGEVPEDTFAFIVRVPVFP